MPSVPLTCAYTPRVITAPTAAVTVLAVTTSALDAAVARTSITNPASAGDVPMVASAVAPLAAARSVRSFRPRSDRPMMCPRIKALPQGPDYTSRREGGRQHFQPRPPAISARAGESAVGGEQNDEPDPSERKRHTRPEHRPVVAAAAARDAGVGDVLV